ncbi:hypothetical protein CYY_008792 [Polysphondylium violaceum]|uniref:Uncharacterized protein n=1 Tax=Polysphondylium violaceum TaxID=133409 RepID=A0A8J4PML7_9MYCE|nr:hypothetical protein CYY_008792 [Polysphondylium violaceum]
MSREQLVSHLVRMIKDNDVEALKSLFAANPRVPVPIHLIIHPMLKGYSEMLLVLFGHTNFRPHIHQIRFSNLVDNVLDQGNRQLFEIVMGHFQPLLYKLLVSYGNLVDPFNFYLALKVKEYKYIKMVMTRMGISELVGFNSLRKYKSVVRILKAQTNIDRKCLCAIARDVFYMAERHYSLLSQYLPSVK